MINQDKASGLRKYLNGLKFMRSDIEQTHHSAYVHFAPIAGCSNAIRLGRTIADRSRNETGLSGVWLTARPAGRPGLNLFLLSFLNVLAGVSLLGWPVMADAICCRRASGPEDGIAG